MVKRMLALSLLVVLLFVMAVFKFFQNNYTVEKKGEQVIIDIVKNNSSSTPVSIVNNDQVKELRSLPVKYYIDNVPFTSQAPTADWKDERQQDGCEEASVVMAMAWVNDEDRLSKTDALNSILDLSTWFESNTKSFHDNYVSDIVRIIKEKYSHENVAIIQDPQLEQIKNELMNNKLVLVPTNGRLLGNPNFSGLGPETHMIVLRGFNDKTSEFIVNDPGTRKGEDYHYNYQTILKAISAYPTGYHEKVDSIEKAVVVVGKK